ncbi:MAG TPA: amino acid permease [Steroidobacteraceae bacterium]|jgi:APA family basic amino acid/polyamine antiporter
MTTDNNNKPFGFWICLALVVGNMIGSGVFLLPASLAPYGTNSLWGWLLTAAGALLLAYVFASLSRALPHAGGPYVFTRMAFGRGAGFLVAWSYWVSVWVGSAAIATGSVSYLLSLFPSVNGDAAAPYVTLGVLWTLTAINCLGLRMAGFVQLITTGLKLLPLIAVALFGAVQLADGRLAAASAAPFQLDSVTAAATLTLWALLGFESATVPADRVRNAEVVLPRAIIIGTLLTAVVYVIACMAVQLALPASQLAQSNAPFADVARLWWGDSAAWWLTLFVVISGIGCLNGWVLVQAEMPRAMAINGAFPSAFARESRFGTPMFALIFTGALVTLVVLANYSRTMVQVFTFMVLIATSANLFVYLVCSLAAIKLAYRGELGTQGWSFRMLATAALLGSIYTLWAMVGAGREAVLWGFALMFAGLPIYWLTRRKSAVAIESAPSS